LAVSDPVCTLDVIFAITRKARKENLVKQMLVLALAMIALALGTVWVVSSVDNARDRNVPGHTTGPGKNSLVE
jgi:hypothetical protein